MFPKSFYEIQNRQFFNNKHIVLVAVVFKGNKIAVVINNTRSSNNRSPKITTDIFQSLLRLALVWFSVNIETVLVFSVEAGFNSFKRGTKFLLHKV